MAKETVDMRIGRKTATIASAPWAKFSMFMMLKINVIPKAISA